MRSTIPHKQLDPGVLALIMLGSLFVGCVAALLAWLAQRNPYAALLYGGGAFVASTTMIITIYLNTEARR